MVLTRVCIVSVAFVWITTDRDIHFPEILPTKIKNIIELC
jgi:hypothetical protein